MAWALNFDGVDDYVSFSSLTSTVNGSSVNWNLEFRIANRSSEAVILGHETSFSDFVILRNANTLEYRKDSITQFFSITDASTVATYRLEARWSGGDRVLSLYENGAFLSSKIIPSIVVAPVETLGVLNGIYRDCFYEDYLLYEDLEDSANSIRLDFTNSSHSPGTVVVSDTINGNNAQGFNFPTDGSAWVDLGGGAQESSVSFSANKPVFTASIENINAGNQTTANFSVSKPLFSASIDNEVINNQVSVNYSTSKPIFFAAIENEQVNNSSDVDFTLNKPAFNVQINNSAGTNVSDIGFSISKPVFNIAVENESPANITNVNFAVSKPLFSASVLNTNPPNELAVNFTIEKPVFTVNIQNGDIVVKFNEETNYSQEYLSTNYSQEYLSTNYDQPYLSTNYTQD